MMRSILAGTLMALVALTSSACAEQTTRQETATFEGASMTYQSGASRPTLKARVVLENGTEVRAECLLEDIPDRAPVMVEQEGDGTWVVKATAEPTIADEVNMQLSARPGDGAEDVLRRARVIAERAPSFEVTGESAARENDERRLELRFADGSSLVVIGVAAEGSEDEGGVELQRVVVAR